MPGFKSCVVQQLRRLYGGVVGGVGVVRHSAPMHMFRRGARSKQQQESFVRRRPMAESLHLCWGAVLPPPVMQCTPAFTCICRGVAHVRGCHCVCMWCCVSICMYVFMCSQCVCIFVEFIASNTQHMPAVLLA